MSDTSSDQALMLVTLKHGVDARATPVRLPLRVPVVDTILEPQLARERVSPASAAGPYDRSSRVISASSSRRRTRRNNSSLVGSST